MYLNMINISACEKIKLKYLDSKRLIGPHKKFKKVKLRIKAATEASTADLINIDFIV